MLVAPPRTQGRHAQPLKVGRHPMRSSRRQAGAAPGLRERNSQGWRKSEAGAEAPGTEGWLQRQHSRGDGFRLFHAPKLGERCHKQTVGDAQSRIGLNGATPGIGSLLVAAAQEIPDGKRVVSAKLQAVKGAEAKSALGPVDRAFRLTTISQGNPTQEERKGRRWAQRERPFKCFERSV